MTWLYKYIYIYIFYNPSIEFWSRRYFPLIHLLWKLEAQLNTNLKGQFWNKNQISTDLNSLIFHLSYITVVLGLWEGNDDIIIAFREEGLNVFPRRIISHKNYDNT